MNRPAPNRSLAPIIAFLGLAAFGFIAAGVMWLLSARYDELPVEYGRSRGPKGAAEPGGTGIFAGMFRREGYRVRTVTRLSPRIDKANVLVWFPTDFEPPSATARLRLESWLRGGAGRALIVVGRDYNPAEHYWRESAPLAPPERQEQFQREAATSAAAHQKKRSQVDDNNGEWFTLDLNQPPQRVTKLDGPWAKDLDAAATEIYLDTRLVPPKRPAAFPSKDEDLLTGDGESIVRESDVGGGRLIVVQNGSFLLNYPLVNREHRKLAGLLIDRCNTSGDVLFIESNSDPPIVNTDVRDSQNIFEFFELWPLNAIVVHAVLLGFLACMAYSPIFGRPRELPAASAVDFSRHVAALGRLLGGTGAREYAVQKLQQYRRRAQRGSGKGHRTPGSKTAAPPAPPAPPTSSV